jgi:hypothetical protein
LLLCVGNFFAEDGSSDIESYINGDKIAPIETYFIVGGGRFPEWWDTLGDRRENGGAVCAGINFLGRAGIKDIHGVSIGFVSGTYDAKSASNAHFGQNHVQQLVGSFAKCKAAWVDVFLTAEWGRGLHRHVSSVQLAKLEMEFDLKKGWCGIGCPIISTLASRLCPRYHFAGSKQRFFERVPYSNGCIAPTHTRFLALGAVPTAGASQSTKAKVPKQARKWLYAMRLVPWSSVTQTSDSSKLTQSPYTADESQGAQGANKEGGAPIKKRRKKKIASAKSTKGVERSTGSSSRGEDGANVRTAAFSLPSPDELFANVDAPSYAQVRIVQEVQIIKPQGTATDAGVTERRFGNADLVGWSEKREKEGRARTQEEARYRDLQRETRKREREEEDELPAYCRSTIMGKEILLHSNGATGNVVKAKIPSGNASWRMKKLD